MNIPGLPEGIELTGYHASLRAADYVFTYGVVRRFDQCTGSFFTCKPSSGYEFVYDPIEDVYHSVRIFEKPVTYMVEFIARNGSELKEVRSILDSLAKHTKVLTGFSRDGEG